jgi:Mg-chelatase subunit ChlI
MTDIKKIKGLTVIDIVNDIANMCIKLGIRCEKNKLLNWEEKQAIISNTSGALAAIATILEVSQEDIEEWMEKECEKHGTKWEDIVRYVDRPHQEAN